MSADPKAVAEMSNSEVVAVARAKLSELAAHDLRFWMAKYANVTAGGPVESGSDHQATRSHIRQLLSDLQMAKSDGEV